jgi:hypothetical protein
MGGLLYFEGRRMTLGGDVRKIVDFGSGGCFLSTGRENRKRPANLLQGWLGQRGAEDEKVRR